MTEIINIVPRLQEQGYYSRKIDPKLAMLDVLIAAIRDMRGLGASADDITQTLRRAVREMECTS